MDYEVCYYYVDNNKDFKFGTLEAAKEFAKEISREFKYYPSIKMVAEIIVE